MHLPNPHLSPQFVALEHIVMAFVSAPFILQTKTVRHSSLCTRRTSTGVFRRSLLICATTPASTPATSSASKEEDLPPVKEFLNSLGALGKVRLVTNNGLAVLESITPLDKLFYATVRGNEYGNVIDHELNVDLHINVNAIHGVRFEIGKSRTNPPVPTYALRYLGADKKEVKLSMFIQWDKTPDDVAPERIEAWKSLKQQYAGESDIAWFKDE